MQTYLLLALPQFWTKSQKSRLEMIDNQGHTVNQFILTAKNFSFFKVLNIRDTNNVGYFIFVH